MLSWFSLYRLYSITHCLFLEDAFERSLAKLNLRAIFGTFLVQAIDWGVQLFPQFLLEIPKRYLCDNLINSV